MCNVRVRRNFFITQMKYLYTCTCTILYVWNIATDTSAFYARRGSQCNSRWIERICKILGISSRRYFFFIVCGTRISCCISLNFYAVCAAKFAFASSRALDRASCRASWLELNKNYRRAKFIHVHAKVFSEIGKAGWAPQQSLSDERPLKY